MLPLTKQERSVLLLLSLIFLIGVTVQYAFKKNPKLAHLINLIDSKHLYYKVDLNKASSDDLQRIPYIGVQTAKRIIEYKQKKGPFTNVDEIKNVKGINTKNFKKFSKYLKI